MNTYKFFMEHFGRHLVKPTGNDIADTEKVLNVSHTKLKGGEQRLSAGWAVVAPSGSKLQLDVIAPYVTTGCGQTRFEAFAEALRGDLPVMLLAFDKKPLALDQLFVTHDRRMVRVCTPAGVETFDLAALPVGMYHRNILKQMGQPA